jgi:four helix bundle protein
MAKTHYELDAWQLADDVRRDFYKLTSRPDVKRDFDFCSDTSRAARSACRNLAEGFYRFKHPEAAHLVNVAQSSLGELLDAADEARMKNYLTEVEHQVLHRKTDRAKRVAVGLYKYLSDSPTPGSE